MQSRLLIAVALAAAASAVVVSAPAGAAPKPSASASPAPAASPTATPEPLDKAIPRLEARLKSDPTDKTAMGELAQDYLQVNRPDLAAQLTKKLLDAGTKTAGIYYTDGIANLSINRIKEGTASLEQAANLEPTNAAVLGALTQVYLQQNRAADAERVAKRAITFNKNDVAAYLAYGQVLAAEGKYDDARAQYEAAAKIDPKAVRPLLLEADTYLRQNAVALAAQLYDRALAIEPNNGDVLLGKARLAAAQHNVKDAIASYEKLLALNPGPDDKVALIAQEAGVYAGEKMDAEADAAFRRAIAEVPNVPQAHTQYGDYLLSKGDKAAAEREFLAGAGPNRDQADALVRLGQLYVQQNQLPKAIDQFKRASQVAGEDPRTHLILGAAYMTNKQYADAAKEYKSAYSLQHSPDALLGLGNADLQTRNYGECAQVFDALDKGVPDLAKQNPNVLYGLGRCQQGANHPDQAKSTYQRLLSYLKPGTQAANEVKGLIASLDRSSKKPAAAKDTKKKS